MERRIDDGYDVFHWSHHPHPDWPENEYIQWVKQQGVEYNVELSGLSKYVKFGMPAEHHQTTWCAEKAIDFMKDRGAAGEPWLFSVNMFDPHHQFDPPKDYLERYLDRLDDIPLPNYVEGELDDKPGWQQIDHQKAYGGRCDFPYVEMSETDHRLVRAAYWAMCDLIDEQVGRMIESLEETGQRENTIVIFTSDHGEMLGDHGIYLKGPYFYEPAVRIPLIISMPETIPNGMRSEALVELVDLAQTILDASEIPHHPGMQGKSLWPLLTGQADINRHRDDVYCEYYNAQGWHENPIAFATMVRDERYKIVVAHGTDGGELYDLEKEPAETTNLWSDPAYIEVKAKMLRKMCDRMAWTADPLPVRESAW